MDCNRAHALPHLNARTSFSWQRARQALPNRVQGRSTGQAKRPPSQSCTRCSTSPKPSSLVQWPLDPAITRMAILRASELTTLYAEMGPAQAAQLESAAVVVAVMRGRYRCTACGVKAGCIIFLQWATCGS